MVKYVDRCHCDHRMTTRGRITSLKGRPDPKGSLLKSKVSYVDSQHAFVSRTQRASFACLSIIGAHSKK